MFRGKRNCSEGRVLQVANPKKFETCYSQVNGHKFNLNWTSS